MGTIGATLAIVGVIAPSIAPGVYHAISSKSGGEVISDAQPATDKDGFPTGRRLADDVTDIELRVIS